MRSVVAAVFISAALLLACGGGKKNPNGNGGECTTGVDFDGDGYGEGCEAGPDCNDADPNFNKDCCWGGNVFEGCSCDPAGTTLAVSCFDGDSSLVGVGPCVEGTRTCDPETEKWSACDGQVLPVTEVCNDGGDEDCDGVPDDGLLSACGNCVMGCDQNGFGDGEPLPTEDDNPNVDQDGVGLDPNGDIVLDSSRIEAHFLWIANDGEGTVSKIDTRSLKEVARYASVTHTFNRLILPEKPGGAGPWTEFDGTVAPWNQGASSGNADNRPSRTAIDFDGNCWVGNRAHDSVDDQPSATKIINNNGIDLADPGADIDPANSDCVDFNGNGVIETSRDLNGDGVISVDPVDGEFFAEDDECIAVTVKVGDKTNTTGARALAIDAGGFNVDFGGPDPTDPGRPWIGLFDDQAFVRLDLGGSAINPTAVATRVPETGTFEAVAGVDIAHKPYGAAIDSKGIVWSIHTGGPRLVGIDSETLQLVEQKDASGNPIAGDFVHELDVAASRDQGYGMVVDLNDKVWVAGLRGNELIKYDPDTGTSTSYPITAAGRYYRTRGMNIDAKGYIWAAIDQYDDVYNFVDDLPFDAGQVTTAAVVRFPADGAGTMDIYDMSDGSVGDNPGGTGKAPVGVGVDLDGHVWTVNRSTSNLSRMYIDPATGSPADDPDAAIDQLTVVEYNTGNPIDTDPYTYSDFTGLSLRLVTRPSGTYSVVIQGCPSGGDAEWTEVDWEATTPLSTSIELYVQVGDDLATIDDQPFYGPWTEPPADLTMAPGPVPDGTYLRVTFRLVSEDRATSPILHGFSVDHTCSGGIR